MHSRPYFYEEEGITHKYVYCNNCPNGQPFKENQKYDPVTKEGSFISMGRHFVLCIPCAKTAGLLKSPENEEEYASYVGLPPPTTKRKRKKNVDGQSMQESLPVTEKEIKIVKIVKKDISDDQSP
jgi:hypothetical protein